MLAYVCVTGRRVNLVQPRIFDQDPRGPRPKMYTGQKKLY